MMSLLYLKKLARDEDSWNSDIDSVTNESEKDFLSLTAQKDGAKLKAMTIVSMTKCIFFYWKGIWLTNLLTFSSVKEITANENETFFSEIKKLFITHQFHKCYPTVEAN